MEPNFREILPLLAKNRVRFILIGAGAAIAHGLARTTYDVDVVYCRDPEDMRNLAAYLQPYQPYLRGEHLQIEEPHVYVDIMDLADAIREGRLPRATAEQARHVVEIVEKAQIAAHTGRTQQLGITFSREIASFLALLLILLYMLVDY